MVPISNHTWSKVAAVKVTTLAGNLAKAQPVQASALNDPPTPGNLLATQIGCCQNAK